MVTMETRAFYDWGRWVANCTHCLSAMQVNPGQAYMECPPRPKGCGGVSPIVWPGDAGAIERGLAGKPEHQRSWNWPADE